MQFWFNDWLLKLIRSFPNAFELYYGGSRCGCSDETGEVWIVSYGVVLAHRSFEVNDDLSEWLEHNADSRYDLDYDDWYQIDLSFQCMRKMYPELLTMYGK